MKIMWRGNTQGEDGGVRKLSDNLVDGQMCRFQAQSVTAERLKINLDSDCGKALLRLKLILTQRGDL